jgi:hypothetical protein
LVRVNDLVSHIKTGKYSKLWVFQNRMLRNIAGPKCDEVTRD